MNITRVARVLRDCQPEEEVEVRGWVRTIRAKPAFSFIELNDGSSLKNLQIVVDAAVDGYEESIKQIESDTLGVVGVDGASFLVRRKLYHAAPADL
ncbi:MAG: asparagine--tRNA ligase, partial [Planctomycetaceae bacterium]|nr:asparagine--tRNA ligase [Planctomycetaceae bacterium]